MSIMFSLQLTYVLKAPDEQVSCCSFWDFPVRQLARSKVPREFTRLELKHNPWSSLNVQRIQNLWHHGYNHLDYY